MSEWFDAEAHADRALEMYERGRWAEAESELRKALSLNPDQAEWHFNLGLTLEAAGRDIEALASFERVSELMPEQAEPSVAAGVVCCRLRRYERAIEWFDRALAQEPAAETAFAHKIDALARLGDHDEAETTFYLAQHALPDPSAHCLASIAESLIEREQFERAGWCLKESLRLEPLLPRVRARLAAVLAATGKPQRALQMYLRDLRDDPGSIDTLLDYGELLIELGRLPEASEKFRRVLEMEPANVDAHFRLGQVAMLSARFEQAHLEFELVLKLDSQFPGIRLSLSEALIKRGQLDAARSCLKDELDIWSADISAAESLTSVIRGDRPASAKRLERNSAIDASIDASLDSSLDSSLESSIESPHDATIDKPVAPAPHGPSSGGGDDAPSVIRLDGEAALFDMPIVRAAHEWERFGDLLLESDLSAEAATVFHRALQRSLERALGHADPDRAAHAALLRKLAIARFRAGDAAGGVTVSRRVLRFDPKCVASIHNLALAALQAGQLRIAAGWIARGLRVDRHDDGLRRLRMQHWIAWFGATVRRVGHRLGHRLGQRRAQRRV